MDLRLEYETLGIYQDVTLSALYVLAAIVSSIFSTYARALDRLAIHYASAWLRISLHAHAQTLVQGGVHPLPSAVLTPSSKVMVDGLPGRKVVR